MKIIDPAALATPRSVTCEWCGLYCRKPTERHHIVSRGMGGGSRLDIRENLIDLGGAFDCDCHGRAQAGKISKDSLFNTVAMAIDSTLAKVKSKVYRLLRADKDGKPKRKRSSDPLGGSGVVRRRPGT